MSPNDIKYRFLINHPLNLNFITKFISDSAIARTAAANTIDFVSMSQKRYYDAKHTSIFMKVSDYAAIWLHKVYLILQSKILGKRLSMQFTAPLRILE